MSIKSGRKVSGSLSVLVLIISAMMSPAVADSTIYRCGSAGSQWFSQIPCEENSEQVIVEDHHMFRESGVADTGTPASAQAKGGSAEQADSASKAQAFITQLEKQRNEQLAEIDRNIEELQLRAEKSDDAEAGDDAEQAASLLAQIQNTRESIVSEYDAMISAARQRIETP